MFFIKEHVSFGEQNYHVITYSGNVLTRFLGNLSIFVC